MFGISTKFGRALSSATTSSSMSRSRMPCAKLSMPAFSNPLASSSEKMCAVTRSLLLVRFIDHRAVERRRQLRELAVAIVDPDLDDVDLLRGVLLDGLAAFLRRRDPVGHFGAALLRRGDAAAGGEDARQARRGLAALRERRVGAVESHAERGADAEVGAPPQVVLELRRRRAGVHVRVDDRRHHRLAGEADARRAGRRLDARGRADLRDAIALRRRWSRCR